MTWIAACSGERGIHQEAVMTDEERQREIERLSEEMASGRLDFRELEAAILRVFQQWRISRGSMTHE